jgi:adenosylmethionine-8-amino-7-oxononanoate aminotransferase
MSAGDPGDFGRPFKDLLFQTHRAELPLIHDPEEEIERKREALRKLFRHLGNRLAGIIIEPMVQGAGGMQMTSAKTLSEVISLTHEHGGLVIADEVMTGFGRTGKLFGHQHQDEKPDILCVAKGLTGGTLPLAATIFRDGLFEAFLDPKKERAFLHGHSFTANPIACAAARASLSLMCEEPFQNDLARIQSQTSKLLENLRGHKNLAEARQLGTIGALKMAGDGGYFAGPKVDLPRLAKDHGVLLRPLGNIVYTMPPLSTSNEQLEMIYGVIETCLDKWS